ncbi:MAG TPA: discoidin domain-containing protein [Gemmataceae bacterium]|nr:discoidin domain-containing protein [Gemmataceae bacterium]
MKHLTHGLTVLAACVASVMMVQMAAPQDVAPSGGGGSPGAQGKPGGRVPTYGGGPVQSQHAVKYDDAALKAHNVPELTTDNKNTLVRKYPGKLLLSASSIWEGWPEALAFDDNPHSSWFTAKGDAVAHGTKPWIQVTFPEDVTVKRVTILGNRDPRWLKGFTILAGTIELLDAKGKRLAFHENDGTGRAYDYDWKLKEPVARVRTVRFNALGDQGKENKYDDIAVGEFQIE